MSRLFSEFRLRDLTFKNRIFVSPMCQYSSEEGLPTDWHLVHLGSRAVGGASLVMVEVRRYASVPSGRRHSNSPQVRAANVDRAG